MTSPERTAFVGSYGPAERPTIHALTVNDGEGWVRLDKSFSHVTNPSYLAVHPRGPYLYAVSETGSSATGGHGAVYAFRVAGRGDAIDLAWLNHRSTEGDFPCHLDIDAGGNWVAVSNYGTGDVVVLPIMQDGSLGEVASRVQHSGRGPHPTRQVTPHAHSATFDPQNRFLIVADLGIDRLLIYAFDPGTGSLTRHAETATTPGAGPRHTAFHPDGSHVFVVNELDNSLGAYRWDRQTGSLQLLHIRSTLAAESPDSQASDVQVAPSGRQLYVSNRGHNSLAVFALNHDREPALMAVQPTGGDWPRTFTLTPGNRHVLVANRRSNEITMLSLTDDGSIGQPVHRAAVSEPSCIAFLA